MKKFWQDAALSTSASDGDSPAHNRFRQHCSNRVTLRGQRNGRKNPGHFASESIVAYQAWLATALPSAACAAASRAIGTR
jgi:hypothetical protein